MAWTEPTQPVTSWSGLTEPTTDYTELPKLVAGAIYGIVYYGIAIYGESMWSRLTEPDTNYIESSDISTSWSEVV